MKKNNTGETMDIQTESFLQGGKFKKLIEERNAQLRQKYDVKKAELEILYFLSHCGEQNTSTDIHHQLMMTRGHISQAVDSLCRRSYIAAIPDQHDRRYVHYQILEPAQELVAEITKQRAEMNKLILDGISEEEMRVFREVSAKIKKNIEKLI